MTEADQDQKDDEGGRNPEVSAATSARRHLRNHKVMLLVLVSLLGLVNGHLLQTDSNDPRPSELRASSTNPGQSRSRSDRDQWQSKASWAGLYDSSRLEEEEGEEHRVRWLRSSSDSISSQKPTRKRKDRRNRSRGRSSGQDCRLERKKMKVRDLGLGYDSDEIVLFKYCVGTCMRARRNYDLALKVLIERGSVPGRNLSVHPCCRPTRFESVSFMDAHTSWHTIKWLSAANCSCVG